MNHVNPILWALAVFALILIVRLGERFASDWRSGRRPHLRRRSHRPHHRHARASSSSEAIH